MAEEREELVLYRSVETYPLRPVRIVCKDDGIDICSSILKEERVSLAYPLPLCF